MESSRKVVVDGEVFPRLRSSDARNDRLAKRGPPADGDPLCERIVVVRSYADADHDNFVALDASEESAESLFRPDGRSRAPQHRKDQFLAAQRRVVRNLPECLEPLGVLTRLLFLVT